MNLQKRIKMNKIIWYNAYSQRLSNNNSTKALPGLRLRQRITEHNFLSELWKIFYFDSFCFFFPNNNDNNKGIKKNFLS